MCAAGNGDEAEYGAIFDMMRAHCSGEGDSSDKRRASASPSPDGGPAGKRLRMMRSFNSASAEEEAGAGAAPASNSAAPPDRVREALELLELPAGTSRADVERQFRTLALRVHPDKVTEAAPDLQEQAAQKFRDLQRAKDVALAWVQGLLIEEAGGEEDEWEFPGSEKSPGELAREEEEGGQEDACWASRDLDPETVDNYKAIGVRDVEDGEYTGRDSEEESADEVIADCWLQVADKSGGAINTNDSALRQAPALKAFQEAAQGRNPQVCSECFQRRARSGRPTCKECSKDLRQLEKTLEGRR